MVPYNNPLHNFASRPSLKGLQALITLARDNPASAWSYLHGAKMALPTSRAEIGYDSENKVEMRQCLAEACLEYFSNEELGGAGHPSNFLNIIMGMSTFEGAPAYDLHNTALTTVFQKFALAEKNPDRASKEGQLRIMADMADTYSGMIQWALTIHGGNFRRDYKIPDKEQFFALAESASLSAKFLQESKGNQQDMYKLMLPGILLADLKGGCLEAVYQDIWERAHPKDLTPSCDKV